MKRFTLFAVALLAAQSNPAATLVWDFEGGGTGTLGDTTGTLFFTSSVDPVANDTAFARGSVGITQPINYDGPANNGNISGEHNTRDVNGVNDWFLRSDHSRNGSTLTKNGDSGTGTLLSDSFLIDTTSAFSFYLGGGGATNPAAFFELIDASDDSLILAATPAVNGHIYGTSNAQPNNGLQQWSSGDLTGAGITGQTEVYLQVRDSRGGGGGHLQLDDITITNAEFVPEPSSSLLGLLGLSVFAFRRRR